MRPSNELVLNAVAVSDTNAYPSQWIPASQIAWASVQAITSGSNPNGTLKIQFSNDNPTVGDPQALTTLNVSDVTNATVSTTNNGVYAVQKAEICANWIRVIYTNASGSGVISARLQTTGN